jgi:hypothetical protein
MLFWSSEVVCERRVFVWLDILGSSRTLLPSYTDEQQLAYARAGQCWMKRDCKLNSDTNNEHATDCWVCWCSSNERIRSVTEHQPTNTTRIDCLLLVIFSCWN